MIVAKRGSIFNSKADALVNPVNLDGVMGRGLAWHFKQKFPRAFLEYHTACRTGQLDIGKLLFTREKHHGRSVWIVAFPTKREWRKASDLSYIAAGLVTLRGHLGLYECRSVALPALGCGLGRLSLYDVSNLVERILGHTPFKVEFYLPQ